jgi:HEAT repeat protein
MKKKRLILLLTLVIALLGVLAWVVFSPAEPQYEGKPLSFWLRGYADSTWFMVQLQAGQLTNATLNFPSPEFAEKDSLKTDAALQQIGPKAIPTLLRLLRAKDTRFKIKVARIAEKLPLIHYSYWPALSRNHAGQHGFQVLGADASNAVPALIEILESHISDDSETATAWSLGMVGPPARAAVPVLLRQLASGNSRVRDAAIVALTAIHAEPETVLPALVKELDNPNENSPSRVFAAVSAFGAEAAPALPGLLSRISSDNEIVRSCVVLGLRKIHPPPDAALPPLMMTLNDTNAQVCRDAAESLGDYGVDAKSAVPALLGIIANTNQIVRDSVVFSLGKIHSSPELCVPALTTALADEDRDVRRHAADSLGAFGTDAKPAVNALLKMMSDTNEDNYSRQCAEIALKKIDPEALQQAVKDGRVKLP